MIEMPRWLLSALMIGAALMLVPLAFVARARVMSTTKPRLHLVQDMDNQSSYKSQQANRVFADERAMRPPVPGTVPQRPAGEHALLEDAHYAQGVAGEGYAADFPQALLPLTRDALERGRNRYEIYCAPCHGLAGYGDGTVARRADELQQGTWVPPSSLHDPNIAARPVGHVYNAITNGIRTMPPYGAIVPVQDRWNIVAYVRALQRSQGASIDDVPPQLRSELREP